MNVVAPDEESILLQKIGRDDLEAILDLDLNGQEFYIENGSPKPRPDMGVSVQGEAYLSVGEVLRVEGIPSGTDVVYPGGRATVDDGFIEWSTNEPGSYYFKFFNFPAKEVEINAIVG
ncbi:Uncharacterised protein [Ectopseudomonas mendocina]|uniref:Uncharacterized protein n=2 Tax=Ectopseudomonas mendocina TaxID=300 RepID=A0A379PPQ2_ECTME|nr:Uncharacterised protein [Pseudomonas mendocina]